MPRQNDLDFDQCTFLACPVSGERLKPEGQHLVAPTQTYPCVDGIPWLFPDPKSVLAEWRERAERMFGKLQSDIAELKVLLKNSPSDLTRKRLETCRALRIDQLEILKRNLEPLKPGLKVSLAKKSAFGYRLPVSQSLLGYFPNLARDWSLHFEIENQTLFDATLQMIDSTKSQNEPQRILVLGAGGARLAYDLAKKYPLSSVVAFDINPILLLTAKAVNSEKKVSTVEHSFAPKNPMQPGRTVELKAPHGPAENLSFVFGDVYALPFQVGAFDLCVTPWLVDILPRKFSELVASVARVVKPEGAWINCGSWFFNFQSEAENISLPEAEEIASELGWRPITSAQVETSYLQSQYDSHRRFETMTLFSWRRDSVQALAPIRVDDRAEWIVNPTLPVPNLASFVERAEALAVMATVLALVDGQRNLIEIAAVVSQENGLTHEQALHATQSFFDRYLKDRRFRELA